MALVTWGHVGGVRYEHTILDRIFQFSCDSNVASCTENADANSEVGIASHRLRSQHQISPTVQPFNSYVSEH